MTNSQRSGYITGAAIVDDEMERRDLRGCTWVVQAGGQNTRVKVIESTARFLLLVEKRNVFEQLVQNQFHLKNDCILITGNGYPGRRFRTLVRDIYVQVNIPFYVLADNDPAGYSLFFLIARGRIRHARLIGDAGAIPKARFLGLRAHDFEDLHLDKNVCIELSRRELDELKNLKSRSWVMANESWQSEFDQMLRNGFKLEMEALCSLSATFLPEEYLPQRLAGDRYLVLAVKE